MADIIQRIVWDDSQFGEGVNRSIASINEVAEAGGNMQEQIDDSLSSMSDAVDKAIKETKKLGKDIDRLQKGYSDLIAEQEQYESALRRSLRWLKSFGVDTQKLTQRLSAFRAKLIDKANALLLVNARMEASTGYAEEFGGTIGVLLNALGNRFPKAAKAVVLSLRAIRVAIISTGIGALVVLLGTLIALMSGLSRAFNATGQEIKNTERIANAFSATVSSLQGVFRQLTENTKSVINGQKSFGQALKDNINALFDLKTVIPAVAAELNKATKATKDAEAAQTTLNVAIAASKDLLNQQREIAADGNKGAAARVAAIKQAGEIEGSLEQQRLKALRLEKEVIDANLRARKIAGQDTKELAEEAIALANEIRFAEADAAARIRADQRAINDLYREGAEELKRFREEYKQLLADLAERLQSARLDELTGADRIKAELDIAIKAINDFEKGVQKAAKKARQAFDPAPFAELRLLAEKKAAQQLRDFEQEESLARLEREKQRLALLGQTLSASFDEQLNIEEAQAAFALEAEKKALEERLKLRKDYYAASGKAADEAAMAEVEQLEINIELVQQKEAELLKKAKERRIREQLDSVALDEQVNDLQLQIIRRSGDNVLTLEQFIEKERLKNQADAIEQRIALLTQLYGPDGPEVKLLRAQLDVIKREIEKVGNDDVITSFWKNLFKVDDTQLAFVGQQFSGAFANITAAAQTFTEIAIEQGRRRIEALTSEIDETERILERELALKEQGYANDYELYRQNLERLTAERDRVALENLEKEKKLANDQLAINTAQQVSEYTLAAIRLFSGGSKLGPIVGVALALGAIGILASTVAQAKANAQRFSEIPKFHEGGPVEGALHSFGGKRIEVEGREFVVKGDVAQRHGDFLGRLNAGAFQNVDLTKLLATKADIGPTLKKMEKDREVIVNLSDRIDYGMMEQIYSRAMGKVSQDVISYLQTRPVERLDEHGNVVKEWKEGNNIRRQRVKSQNSI